MKTYTQVDTLSPETLSHMLKEIQNHRKDIESFPIYFGTHLMKERPWYVAENTSFSSVWLRGPSKEGKSVHDELRSCNTELIAKFPYIASYILSFAKKECAVPGRISIFFLSTKQLFKLHVDNGRYYIFHKRYHIVLQSDGSRMIGPHEYQKMFYPGDVFFINNKEEHTGERDTEDTERIHVIFDIMPYRLHELLYLYVEWIFFTYRYSSLYKYFYRSLWKERWSEFIGFFQSVTFARTERISLYKRGDLLAKHKNLM